MLNDDDDSSHTKRFRNQGLTLNMAAKSATPSLAELIYSKNDVVQRTECAVLPFTIV